MIPKTYSVLIGIDVGHNTGFALYNRVQKRLDIVFTDFIHCCMVKVLYYHRQFGEHLLVRVEDPRKNFTWNKDPKRLEGVGAVKAHATIWEDFLKENKIKYEMVKPNRKLTKWEAVFFKKATGYTGKTDSHSRDASLLVYQR